MLHLLFQLDSLECYSALICISLFCLDMQLYEYQVFETFIPHFSNEVNFLTARNMYSRKFEFCDS